MNTPISWAALSAVVLTLALYPGAGHADDAAVIEERQALMKGQGKDAAAIKAFTDDKTDLAAAQAAGADLLVRLPKISDLVPKGTGMDAYPGKSYAKPAIWTEHDKFLAAQKNAIKAAEALNAALKGGDKTAISAALGNLTRDFWGTTSTNPGACGGCHGTFTQKKPS